MWLSQSAYVTAAPGEVASWTVAFLNTGSAGWYRGRLGANAALGTSNELDNVDAENAGLDPGNWQYANRLAMQSTDYVGPGQVGWFVVQVRAPQTPGVYTVHVRPVIDGVAWLEDYGVFFTVTVTTKR